jgi:hypothetical protein
MDNIRGVRVMNFFDRKMIVGFILGLLALGISSFMLFTAYSSHSGKPTPSVTPLSTPQDHFTEHNSEFASVPGNEWKVEPSTQIPMITPIVTPTVNYDGPIEHIFFHPLIAYPELAFDGDSLSKGYDDWFVTVKEFKKILDSLYAKQYVLIDIRSLYEEMQNAGKTEIKSKTLKLPSGKKPLVLSIDDLNYYTYMRENGNVFRLVLDKHGEIAAYSVTPQGEESVSRDNEIIPILDDFVKLHPDFSVDGAKGTLALTGYEGILGYRTDQLNSPDFEKNKAAVLPVIHQLKETGWTFASHGYGHLDAAKITYDRFSKDTSRWKKEVEPLIGPTSIYIFPFGSKVLPGDPKYTFLLDSGFRMFCSVGPSPYLKVSLDSLRMDRRHIDGIAFHDQKKRLLPLFDVNEVIDEGRPSYEKPSVNK